MANINKIRLSGTTYNIEDENAAKSVTLTQAEYDALVSGGTVDPNTFYIISDSSIEYMTSADTESAITQAVSGKQDTLVSGTNIKTINNQSLLGSGNISIQAGGISSVEADYDDSTQPNGEFDILINDGSSYSQIFVVGDGLQVTEEYGNTILSATGGGISSGEVQTMIDSSISGKTNQSDFSAHTANTTVHVTAQDKTNWNAKSDFSGSYNDLTDKPTIPTVPTSNTAFTNDAGYITSNDITGKTDTTAFTAHTADTTIHVTTAQTAAWDAKSDFSGSYNDLTDKPTIPTVPTSNTAFTNDAGYITSSALDGYATTATTSALNNVVTGHTANTTVHVTAADKSAWNAKSDFSGSYNDLTDKLTAGTGIDITDNVISATGGGGGVNVVQTTGTSTTDVMSQDAVTTQLSGYVTTNTNQTITNKKTFTNSDKAIEFKQNHNNSKVGFTITNSAATNNEVASFEFRPNTFTIDEVQHPLMYFGHYRRTAIANAGVPQTVIGFRQYDQLNAAAYHYLMPLPEKAKTPFNLTTSFKDYYAPMGFKNGSTMITADDTGVVDLSSELGGLKLVKLTQAEYDALATKDSNTLYVING